MTRRAKIIAGIVVAGLVSLIGVGFLPFGPDIIKKSDLNHRRIQNVGIGIKAYADDHGEMMPISLDDLVPAYLPKDYDRGVEFLTPGKKLSELPAKTVILRQVFEKDHVIAIIHADGSGEMKSQ